MKTKLTFLCFLAGLFAASAFGQGVMAPPQTAFKTVNGVTMPIASATITVCAANATGVPCSPALSGTVFKDSALTQPLSNPFTADASGNYQFAAAPGQYTVTVTATGFSGYSSQISIIGTFNGGTVANATTFSGGITGTGTVGALGAGSGILGGVNTWTAAQSFNSATLFPSVAGGTDLGSISLPFGNLWIGTAATNNFKVQPSATGGPRAIVIPDFGAFGLLTQQFPATVVLHTAYTNATTTFSTLGDGSRTVSFPVAASVDYTLSCKILYQGSATTAGPKVQLTGPASPTAVNLMVEGGTNATAYADAGAAAFSSAVTAFGTLGAATTNFVLHIEGGIANGTTAGTVALQLAANGSGTLTVQPGSYCRIQ